MAAKTRGDVIFTGIGGGGVLMAGEILSQAAITAYKHVVFFPNYSGAVRGGPSECSVIYSDEEIACPVLSYAGSVVVLAPAQMKSYEDRVRPGGILIVESGGLRDEVQRKDVTVLRVPAVEEARAMGNPRSANLILLGVYVGSARLISPDLVEKEMERRMSANAQVLSANLEAFRRGLAAGRSGVGV